MATERRHLRFLLILSFLAFVSLGLPDGILGVAWPSIAHTFRRPLSRLALLQLAATAGFFISSTNAGRLIRILGVGRLLIVSNVFVSVGIISLSFAGRWPVVVAAMTALGVGGGAIDAGLNAYSAERFSKEQVTLLHAFYGLGAMIGPLIMRRVLRVDAPWQVGYRVTAGMIGALLVLFVVSRNRWADGASSADRRSGRLDAESALSVTTLRAKRVIGVAFFLIYTGLEVTAGAWTFSWLTAGRGVAEDRAALWVGVYWIALTAGRLFFGFVGRRWHARSILSAMIAAVVCGTLLFLQPWSQDAALAALPVIGFACAPLFPLFVSYTRTVVGPHHGATAIGRQVAAASVGSALVPLAVGLGVDAISLVAIPIALVLFAALLAAVYIMWKSGVPR